MSSPSSSRIGEPQLWTRSFVLLNVAHFLQGLGYSSMILLPLYLQHLGASRTEIGLMMATASLGGLVLRPLIGWSLDSWGRRPTIYAGTLALVAGMALVGLVDAIGIMIYVQRAIFGIGVAALFTSYFTLAADLVPAERRTEGMALFGIFGLLPLLVNPLSDHLEMKPAQLRWFLPAMGGLVALSAVFAAAAKRPKSAAARPRVTIAEILSALRRRALWPVWLGALIFAGMVAVLIAFANVTAERRGIGRPASLWLTYAGAAVFVRLIGARLPARLGPANLLAPALGCYIVAALLLSRAADVTDLLVAGVLAGVGHGYSFPILVSQVVGRTEAAFHGSAMALFTALFGLTELLMTPLFGAVADRHGDGAMFLLLGAWAALGLILWLVLEHRFGPARA